VRFEDSRLSLDHLAQSPETGPLPVGQATALPPAHQIGLPGDPGMKFAHQPGLAHPRFTGNSDQLNTRLPGGPVKRTLQSDELRLLSVQFLYRLMDPQPGAYRALGIVLMGDRGAEHSHDRVTDELLNRGTITFQLAPQPTVIGAESSHDVFGVSPVSPAGRAD